MFNSLRAKNHKGIRTVDLKDLGNINVLCGKNNSGKTSLLESLNSHNNRAVGVLIEEDQISKFEANFSKYITAKRFTSPSPNQLLGWFNTALHKILDQYPVWYTDEIESLHDKLTNLFNAQNDYNLSIPFGKFIEDIFKIELKTILIPPKRTLEHQAQINFNEIAEPDGEGVVNFLFYLKSQPLRSEEHKIYLKIDEAFTEIANGWTFNIFAGKDNKLTVHFTQDNETWHGSDACGLGLSDILIINTLILAFDNNLILLEEPESHVHPDMQRRLLHFLKSLKDRQFIVTTHSNVFLDNAFVDRVLFCSNLETVEVSDTTNKASVLDDLGYSVVDNLISDLVVLVEGPKDIQLLEVLFQRAGLDEYNIRVWPLGGDIMDQINLEVMVENRRCIALIDKDTKSRKVRRRFIENCREFDIEVTKLKRYAIENYFPLRALKDVFGSQIPDTITEIDKNKKLENQIDFNVKKNNREIAETMTDEEIEETEDLYDFIQKVREICEGT